MWTAEHRHKLQ